MIPFRFVRLKTDLPKPPADSLVDTTLIQALHDGLRQKFKVGEIKSSEFDHDFICHIGEFKYIVSASFDYVDEQWWEADFREAPTFLPRLFGKNEEPAARDLALSIDSILRKQNWAKDIRWYKNMNSPPDEDYSTLPVGIANHPRDPNHTKASPRFYNMFMVICDKYTKLFPWLFGLALLITLFSFLSNPTRGYVSGVPILIVFAGWLGLNGFGILLKLYLAARGGNWPDSTLNWLPFLTFSMVGISFTIMCAWIVIAMIR